MFTSTLKWKLIAAVTITFSVFGVLNATVLKERFCPVVADFKVVNSADISTNFDQARIAYFIDFNDSQQILVKKSQVNDARIVLNRLGIESQFGKLGSCRVVH